MNYKITFSTYVNNTGKSTGRAQLQRDLVLVAKNNNIQGFTLTDQVGYWAGEIEASHALTLLDTTPQQARAVALALKKRYYQDAVILERLASNMTEFI
jgi:hypothetical protein